MDTWTGKRTSCRTWRRTMYNYRSPFTEVLLGQGFRNRLVWIRTLGVASHTRKTQCTGTPTGRLNGTFRTWTLRFDVGTVVVLQDRVSLGVDTGTVHPYRVFRPLPNPLGLQPGHKEVLADTPLIPVLAHPWFLLLVPIVEAEPFATGTALMLLRLPVLTLHVEVLKVREPPRRRDHLERNPRFG